MSVFDYIPSLKNRKEELELEIYKLEEKKSELEKDISMLEQDKVEKLKEQEHIQEDINKFKKDIGKLAIEKFENSLQTSDFTDDLYTKLYTDTILEKLYQKNKRWHDICLLHYLLGMSIREISEVYNCSESSVSNALYRAKKYILSQDNSSLDLPCIVILVIVAGIQLS